MSGRNKPERSVRARRDEAEVEERNNTNDSELSEESIPAEDDTEGSSSGAELSDRESDTSSKNAEDQISLKDISFGTLAKAQASLEPSTGPSKRKRTAESNDATDARGDDTNSVRPFKSLKPSSRLPSRSSKHAPQTLSTRKAVTRRRTVFEPEPSLKSRDPRFDPTVISSSRDQLPLESEKVNKNYSFLTEYRQSELQSLQAQVKAAENLTATRGTAKKKNKKMQKMNRKAAAAVDEETLAKMKREIQSLSARMAMAETKTREREIVRAHKVKEREDIREGRKSRPFFLKKGQVRKEIEVERYESLGKRARDKKDERRQKREKGKEGREMPRVRRGMEMGTGNGRGEKGGGDG